MTTTAPARSEPPAAAPPEGAGRTELGRITVDARVVAKIAARAVLEIPDAGGASPRVLGLNMPAAQPLGLRRTALDSLPKTSAVTDGALTSIDVTLSVRWPASVSDVTNSVRQHLVRRVNELTGLTVAEVNITVSALITRLDPGSRVD